MRLYIVMAVSISSIKLPTCDLASMTLRLICYWVSFAATGDFAVSICVMHQLDL